jgi:hypothetical protein
LIALMAVTSNFLGNASHALSRPVTGCYQQE